MKFSIYESYGKQYLVGLYNPNVNYSKLAKVLTEKYKAEGIILLSHDPIEMFYYNHFGEKELIVDGLVPFTNYCVDKFDIYKYIKVKVKDKYYKCEMLEKKPALISICLGLPMYPIGIIDKDIIISDRVFKISTLFLNELHTIIIVNDFNEINYAPRISECSLFKDKTNVDFVKVVDNKTIEVSSYLINGGWTKTSINGVASCATLLHEKKGLSSKITCITAGGIITISIKEQVYSLCECKLVKEIEED